MTMGYNSSLFSYLCQTAPKSLRADYIYIYSICEQKGALSCDVDIYTLNVQASRPLWKRLIWRLVRKLIAPMPRDSGDILV